MMTSGALANGEADGSRLCLECGLCCNGILHGYVKLRPDELPRLRRSGLVIVESEAGPSFQQPCLCYQDDHCTVYAERPRSCRWYRCKLLDRYESGELTWEESAQRVRQARELIASLLRRLPEGSTGKLWQRLQALGNAGSSATAEQRELLLDAVTLRVILQTHFDDLEC